MRRSTGGLTLTYLSGAVAVLAVTDGTWGQTCYRVTDLRTLQETGGSLVPGDEDTFGINNAGEVVFTAEVALDCAGAALPAPKKHAFLWLAQDNYGLNAGLHDLHCLSGQPDAEESAAHDINMQGQIAGQAGGVGPDVGFAIVWEISAGVVTFIDLRTFSAPNDGPPKITVPRIAFAISDAIPAPPRPAIVVGDAEALSDCALQNCPPVAENTLITLGFSARLDGTNLLDELLPLQVAMNCDGDSFARDLASVRKVDPDVVGFSDFLGTGICNVAGSQCEVFKDGVRWNPGPAAAVLLDLDQGGDLDVGAESRGNNDSFQIVGWGRDDPPNDCVQRALFWESAGAIPFELGTVPPLTPAQQTRAEAINNPDASNGIQVVGTNLTAEGALLWERPTPSSSWSVEDLNDEIAPCADDWAIRVAYDINDSGWIVGWGLRIATGVPHALLLTPHSDCVVDGCDPDIVVDGAVNVPDLLTLLGAWGPCPDVPASCRADLDCDGAVAVPDLLELLGAWGPCPLSGASASLTLQEEIENAGLVWPDDWNLFQDCMTNGTQAEADNCLCWMDHYLGTCTGEICDPDPCPGADPFDGPHLGL